MSNRIQPDLSAPHLPKQPYKEHISLVMGRLLSQADLAIYGEDVTLSGLATNRCHARRTADVII